MTLWLRTVDIAKSLNSDKPWREIQKEVVEILRKDKEFSCECIDSIDMMEEAETEEEFDNFLDEIYDYADENLIWMGI